MLPHFGKQKGYYTSSGCAKLLTLMGVWCWLTAVRSAAQDVRMEDRYEWEPVRTDYHRSDRHGTALGLRLSAGLCALLWFCLPASAAVTIVDDGDAGYSESVIFGVLEGGYGSDNRQSNSGGATAAYSFTGTPNTYYEVLNNVAWVSTTDYPSTPNQIVGAVTSSGTWATGRRRHHRRRPR